MKDINVVKSNTHILNIFRESDVFEGRDNLICLDMNERVSAFPETFFQDMLSNITSKMFSSYPHIGPLYRKLENFTGLKSNWLCLGAGSDSLIRRAFQAYLSPGDRLVTPKPTYGMYNVWARVFEARHDTLDYSATLKLDIDKFIYTIGDNARIVALASPDQPTGHTVELKNIQRIADKTADKNTLLLIDEAYFPFGKQTAQNLLKQYPHLLIIRSFSKAGGLAGLRVGYAMAAPEIIQALHAVRGPGEVNSIGAYMAAYLLDHPDIMEQFYKAVQEGRSILIKAATKMGFDAPRCDGNFQLLRVPIEITPKTLADALKRQNYLIKSGFSHHSLEQYVRVTLDGPKIMDTFIKTLASVTEELLSSSRTTSTNETV